MTNKIQKKDIYIDRIQQDKERNIDLGDYPVFNIKTNRQLKHRFRHYFKDLDDYYSSKNSDYKNWSHEYKHTSHEAYLFFDDIEDDEYRL